jgi:Fur family ferric uptake transcriptional regulator
MKSTLRLKAQALLNLAGLRRTGPRLAILSALLDAGKPVTHEQITARLAEAAPNKVTIYRVLESFVEAGIVHKAFLRERAWHFELADRCSASQCHPHFTCTSCAQTYCFTGATVPMTKPPRGFTILHQRVQLEGLCPACNEKKAM